MFPLTLWSTWCVMAWSQRAISAQVKRPSRTTFLHSQPTCVNFVIFESIVDIALPMVYAPGPYDVKSGHGVLRMGVCQPQLQG